MISFDRFARVLFTVAALFAVYFSAVYLSPVLLPFFIAVAIAFLLRPVVDFLQFTCHLRVRFICVILSMAGALALLVGALWLCVPPLVEEVSNLRFVVEKYLSDGELFADFPPEVQAFVENRLRLDDLDSILSSPDVANFLRTAVPRLWSILSSTFGVVLSAASWLIGLLYLFFLLQDYHSYVRGWRSFVPPAKRPFVAQLLRDVAFYMGGYFRGQFFIALSNCVMFTLGFFLLGFPMPIALGLFIGIISFVPYLQVVGIIPGVLLAWLRAAETGDSFWLLIGILALVYVVVQILQDTVVTPHIMGRIMGLSPAIILFSLSIGAYIAGIGGLIVALPVTTLGLAYYKRYVVRDPAVIAEAEADEAAFRQADLNKAIAAIDAAAEGHEADIPAAAASANACAASRAENVASASAKQPSSSEGAESNASAPNAQSASADSAADASAE